MASDNKETLDRRNFLKVTTRGAALLAAGLVSKSTYAEDRKSQVQNTSSGSTSTKKIELLFLGTGAADWSRKYPPAEKPLARGEVRGMSSMLVNGTVLIDCGPTVLSVMKRYNVSPADINDIFLTHTHSDHLHNATLLAIADARKAAGLGPLMFHADPEALKRVPESELIEKIPVAIGKTTKVDGFGVTGLGANHMVKGSDEKCLIYFIEGAGKSFLYATDTGWLLTSTWDYLQKKELDAVIWEATVGEGKGDYRIFCHNDLTMIRHMNETLKAGKVLKRDAKIILTHMARTLHPSHEQLENKLLPEGLIPAYDGMSVTLSENV